MARLVFAPVRCEALVVLVKPAILLVLAPRRSMDVAACLSLWCLHFFMWGKGYFAAAASWDWLVLLALCTCLMWAGVILFGSRRWKQECCLLSGPSEDDVVTVESRRGPSRVVMHGCCELTFEDLQAIRRRARAQVCRQLGWGGSDAEEESNSVLRGEEKVRRVVVPAVRLRRRRRKRVRWARQKIYARGQLIREVCVCLRVLRERRRQCMSAVLNFIRLQDLIDQNALQGKRVFIRADLNVPQTWLALL